jgi:hypothetical protein
MSLLVEGLKAIKVKGKVKISTGFSSAWDGDLRAEQAIIGQLEALERAMVVK